MNSLATKQKNKNMNTKQTMIIFYTMMKSLAWSEPPFWRFCSWTHNTKLWNERTETSLICKNFLHGLFEDTFFFFLNHAWILLYLTVFSTSVGKHSCLLRCSSFSIYFGTAIRLFSHHYTLKIMHETVTSVHLFNPHVDNVAMNSSTLDFFVSLLLPWLLPIAKSSKYHTRL